ncbi:MAG: CehA/McbA family metallohydrolase [Verrucomicrobiota bacterium]
MEKCAKKYRFDLHTHSRFSHDCHTQPEDLVAAAKAAGLDGLAITDHDNSGCVEYFSQVGLLRDDGQPVDDFLIIPGQEISTSSGHMLTYCAKLPNLRGISPEKAIELVRMQNGLCFPAHPYDRFRSGIREKVLDRLDIDGIEGFNAACTFQRYNQQAEQYGKKKQIPLLAGSDSHDPETVGLASTELLLESFDLSSVLEALKGSPKMCKGYITLSQSVNKTFGLVFPRVKARKAQRSAVKVRVAPAK